jgi:hypothetical protein
MWFFLFTVSGMDGKLSVWESVPILQKSIVISIFTQGVHLGSRALAAQRLRHYSISRKVAGSRPDEVNEFFFSSLPNPCGRTRPWGSLSLYQKCVSEVEKCFVGSMARPVRRADNLAAICEQIA